VFKHVSDFEGEKQINKQEKTELMQINSQNKEEKTYV